MEKSEEPAVLTDPEATSENQAETAAEEPVEEPVVPETDAAPTEAEPPAPDIQIAALEQVLGETQDKLLRQVAEFQNFRRRSLAERNSAVAFGRTEVITAMLDVLDDLRRSIASAEQVAEQEPGGAAFNALKTGVDLVYQKFELALKSFGIEAIEAVGQPFNEQEHEALMQQPAPEGTPAGTVLAEIQKGYRMGDRILRHTKVVVAQE